MPKTAICFLIGAFSISGLPPFNGFLSKWQIYQAAYMKSVESGNFLYIIVTIVAVVVSVMTLASFIKVTQAVFFGQVPESCKDVKEVPLSMRIPMWIMSVLCIATGIGANFVNKVILTPASTAAFSVSKYIDSAMGAGYASSAGVTDIQMSALEYDLWNPIMWLILFGIILVAVFIVALTGTGRAPITFDTEVADGRGATYFGGERYSHSHVGGSDLFWGFKKNWTGYFRFMDKQHSGVVNDYALWVVVTAVLVVIFMFIFRLLV